MACCCSSGLWRPYTGWTRSLDHQPASAQQGFTARQPQPGIGRPCSITTSPDWTSARLSALGWSRLQSAPLASSA